MNKVLQILWHRVYSVWFELTLGIDTRGVVGPPNEESVHYTPLPYPMIVRMLKLLELKPNDVFVDIGCGKGRVVCCVCRFPIKRVVALELNPDLLNQTLENIQRMRGRKALIEPVQRTAEDYEYPDATVVYLYNPFNARVTASVMDKLFESHSQSPRIMRVVYANPVH